MAVSDPKTKEGRKPTINHRWSICSTFGVYCTMPETSCFLEGGVIVQQVFIAKTCKELGMGLRPGRAFRVTSSSWRAPPLPHEKKKDTGEDIPTTFLRFPTLGFPY